nr:hypothetical protein [uncultured Trichococcus sp.]
MNKRQLWKKIKQRGPILWDNTDGIMRYAGPLYAADENGELTDEIVDYMPQTYTFKGIPTYNSYSAMVPCGSKKDPYEFMYYDFDEDEGTGEGWTGIDLYNPLRFQTEKEFLERIGGQAT